MGIRILKKLGGKNSPLYLCTYFHFWCSSFLPDDLRFHLVSFPFSLKNFFKAFLEVEVCCNEFSFYLKMSFFQPLFLKDISTRWYSSLAFFFLILWFLIFWFLLFLVRSQWPFVRFPPLYVMLVFLWLFSWFSF